MTIHFYIKNLTTHTILISKAGSIYVSGSIRDRTGNGPQATRG